MPNAMIIFQLHFLLRAKNVEIKRFEFTMYVCRMLHIYNTNYEVSVNPKFYVGFSYATNCHLKHTAYENDAIIEII